MSNFTRVTFDMIRGVLSSARVMYKSPLSSAIDRLLSDKLRDTVSLKDFGAKCDGSTDDTDKFQLAINSLPTGGRLLVPGGSWIVVNGVLEVNSGIIIEGDNTTLIKTSGTSSEFFYIKNSGITLSNLILTGVGYSSSGANTYAINVETQADRFTAKDLKVREVWGGLRLNGTVFTVENVEINHFAQVGAHVDQSGNIDGIGLFHNYVTTPAPGVSPYAGIKLEHAVGILVSDSEIMGCNNAIACDSPAGKFVTSLKVDNTYMDSSLSAGFAVYANGGYVQRVVISDSWMSGTSSGAGFRAFDNAKIYGLVIDNCEANGNGTYGVLFGDNCDMTNVDVKVVTSGNGVADVSFGINSKNFAINGSRIGVTSSSYPASPVGLFIGAGSYAYSITGSTLVNFTDNSYPTSGVVIDSVRGWGYSYQTVTPVTIAAQSVHTFNVGVTGARAGDMVKVSLDGVLSNIVVSGAVIANDVVQVQLSNNTSSTVSVAAMGARVSISRYF